MGNLGGPEILVIFFVALIVLGPTKLPEAARQVGKAVNEVRRVSSGFQREMRDAMREPIEQIEADDRRRESARRPSQPAALTAAEEQPSNPEELSTTEPNPDSPSESDTETRTD